MDKQPIDLVQFSAQIEDVGNFHDLACAFTGHRPQKFPWGFNGLRPACCPKNVRRKCCFQTPMELSVPRRLSICTKCTKMHSKKSVPKSCVF